MIGEAALVGRESGRIDLRTPAWPALPESTLRSKARAGRLRGVVGLLVDAIGQRAGETAAARPAARRSPCGLSNALRYSPVDQSVDVTVAVESGWCSIVVADRGVGLTVDEADRVFERLYRTDDARSRVRGGTGLGLAIVRSVVEAHSGSVAVRSEPGVGSTFVVRLPLIAASLGG